MKRLLIPILSLVLFAGHMQAMEMPDEQSGHLGERLISAVLNLDEPIVVQHLLDMNADVNYATRFGTTPLMCAAHEGKKLICELLIKRGADIFYTNAHGNSALERATRWGEQPISELLVEKMLSLPTPEQKAGVYAFAQCLKRMCPGQFHNVSDVFKPHLRALIAKENTHKACRAVCALDETPTKNHLIETYFEKEELLYLAAEAGDEKCVQQLIVQGIGADDYADSGKRTALSRAAYMGWDDIVELLIDAGADPFQKDENFSVLQNAAVSPHYAFAVKPSYEIIVEKMISKAGEARARAEIEKLATGEVKEYLLQKYFSPTAGNQ